MAKKCVNRTKIDINYIKRDIGKIMERMTELVQMLNEYAYRYYTLDEPIVSDKEYDVLYDELVELEKSSGVVLPDSPTHRVGGELLKQFDSYTHKQRLYSLAKSQSTEELESWWTRCTNSLNIDKMLCSVEFKYDGLTVNLSYKNGELVRATTRGRSCYKRGKNYTYYTFDYPI